MREVILERDGYECQIRDPGCVKVATEVDHIRPLSEGGAFLDPANLRAACRKCNRAAGARASNAERAASHRMLSRLTTRDVMACPRGPHGPVGGICSRCGYPGPSRAW